MQRIARFGSNHLFELDARDGITPNPPPRFPPIPIEPHQLRVSHGHEQTHYAVDGRLDSGWTTGLRKGAAWTQVRLEVSHDVRQVRLELGRSRDAFPPDLTIVSGADDGQERQLYAGGVLPQLAVGLVHEPLTAPIVISLPPNRTRVLTLLVSEAFPDPWSVHELILYGQP